MPRQYDIAQIGVRFTDEELQHLQSEVERETRAVAIIRGFMDSVEQAEEFLKIWRWDDDARDVASRMSDWNHALDDLMVGDLVVDLRESNTNIVTATVESDDPMVSGIGNEFYLDGINIETGNVLLCGYGLERVRGTRTTPLKIGFLLESTKTEQTSTARIASEVARYDLSDPMMRQLGSVGVGEVLNQ
jgi:hypothetical protein